MLTLFRRHVRACPHRSRRYRRCRCPISIEGTLPGEPIRKALDLTSWEAAERRVLEWDLAGKIDQVKSLNDAVDAFVRDARARKLRDGTIELYEQTLWKFFMPWCEKNRIEYVRHVTLERLRDFRETWTCSATTSARRIDRLRTFFRFCVDSGWISTNPATRLRSPATRQQLRMPFTSDELEAIFAVCDRLITRGTYGKDNRHRVKAFVYVLRYTGLRLSDAIRLDTSKVADGRVFLCTEKTGVPVWIPVPEFVLAELEQVPRVGPYYFQTGSAKVKTLRGGWDRTLRTILKLASVNHGSAHVFR